MGDEEKLPEWLPSDWTMEVRMRRDGRSYKCFKDPASDLTFYSKPEVLRHLKHVSVKHSKSKKTKRKSTSKRNKSAMYAVKKSVAERLPSGWIEEIKVRKKRGRENRVDKFYIDPESGRVFRSMKEVSRYLETGEIGRSTLKLKDKGHVDEAPNSHTSSTRAEYEKKSAPKSKTCKKIHKDQAVKSAAEGEGVEITESKANKEVHKDRDRKSTAEREGDNVPDSKGAGDERDKVLKRRKNKEVVKNHDLMSSAEGERGERERAPDNKTNKVVVKDQGLKSGAECEGERVPDNKDAGDERDKMSKRRKTKEVVKDQDLKSSAETEGGETDRAPDRNTNEEVVKDQDLKSGAEGEGDGLPDGEGAGDERDKMPKRKKIREVVKDQDLKSIAEGEVVKDQDLKSGSRGTRKRIKTLPTDKKLAKRVKESDFSESMSALTSLKTDDIIKTLPPVNSAERPENNILNDETGAAMPRRTSKRLAGVEVHQLQEIETNSRARQVASEQLSETVDISKNIKDLNSSDKHMVKVRKGSDSDVKRQGPVLLPAGYLPLSQDHVQASGTGKHDEDVAVPLDSSSKDFLNDPCIEFAIKTLTGTVPIGDDKAHNPGRSASNAFPASSPALPYGDLWRDPCFEFAVKTLTGEIPLEDDSCIKTLFQQPLNSSEAHRHNGLSSSTVKSDSFTPVNNLFTHFGTTDEPLYRQQNLVAPAVSRIQYGSS